MYKDTFTNSKIRRITLSAVLLCGSAFISSSAEAAIEECYNTKVEAGLCGVGGYSYTKAQAEEIAPDKLIQIILGAVPSP